MKNRAMNMHFNPIPISRGGRQTPPPRLCIDAFIGLTLIFQNLIEMSKRLHLCPFLIYKFKSTWKSDDSEGNSLKLRLLIQKFNFTWKCFLFLLMKKEILKDEQKHLTKTKVQNSFHVFYLQRNKVLTNSIFLIIS